MAFGLWQNVHLWKNSIVAESNSLISMSTLCHYPIHIKTPVPGMTGIVDWQHGWSLKALRFQRSAPLIIITY
jgi:hypothetical protein